MSSSPIGHTASDELLIEAIAHGDQDAFVTLFRRRRAEIYRFVLHMTASPATSEDVTQEVFLTVMRDAVRYEPARAAAMAWLCGIARNHVRRRAQRDRLLEPLHVADDAYELWAAPAEDPVNDLARAERTRTIRRAVLSLPLRYREVIVLCDLQELSYADAAAAIGCAVGTVRSRLHRARALLAQKLNASAEKARHKTEGKDQCFA
jgi:RNA polymerase sigma-70 factor (ECF subfamily)